MAGKSNVLQTVVEIAGSVSSSLNTAVTQACKQLETVNVKAATVATACVAGALAVGKAVVEATKYLVDLGTQFDEVSDTIRAGTGATGEALEELVDDFDAVYSSVPTSMDDAAAAIANYNTLLGLTGEDLQNISVQAIQVANLLGDDLDTVIESSSHAFQQWNLATEDMGAAMDHVFKVSQSTGVGFSELMEKVQGYGAQLQGMGYSFEEATALIGQLEKSGTETSEVLSAMKKSVTTLAAEGIDAADGLQMYVDAIMNAEDATRATAIASEVFGTRAASTMAAAIRDGSLSLDNLTASLDASDETINACAEDTYDFAERLQLFKQQAEVALEPLADTLFDTLNDLMPVAADLISEVLQLVSEMAEVLTPLIQDVVSEIVPMLSSLLKPIVKIANSLLKKIIPPLMQIITTVLPVIIQLVELIAVAIEPVFDALGSVLPIIATLIEAVVTVLSKLLSKILPVLQTLLEAIMPIVTNLIDAVLPVLVGLLDTLMPILDLVLSVLEPILDVLLAVLQPILSLINTLLKPLITLFQKLVGDALKPLQVVINAVADLFTGVLGAALETITPLIQMITDVLSGLIDFITNVFQGNWSGAWEAISGIFSNIWNGVVGFFKGVINGLIGIVESGLNASIKLINGITGGLSNVWTWTGLPAIPEIPLVTLPRLASGGFTEGVSIAGEEGTEAVISFDPAYHEQNVELWEQAGKLLGVVDAVELSDKTRSEITAAIQTLEIGVESTEQETVLTKASELATMDDFSLGMLTETTIIYYDFSNFKWSPQVQFPENGKVDKEEFMEKLKEHESEFFDWLDEWLVLKGVGRYDRVEVY